MVRKSIKLRKAWYAILSQTFQQQGNYKIIELVMHFQYDILKLILQCRKRFQNKRQIMKQSKSSTTPHPERKR